jgi:hypothetical protein
MTSYKMWKDLPSNIKHRYATQFAGGTRFEMSYNGENWFEMSRATSFYNSSYYRIKGETSMTDGMTPFGKLDPVKQGEILVAFRNGDPNLQQWLWASETWGDIKGIRQIFNDTMYRIRAAPRVCYVVFDKDNCPVSTTGYKVLGSVLMREVMED